MNVLISFTYGHLIHTWCQREEGVPALGIGVMVVSRHVVLGLNTGPQEEQPVLVTIVVSLQPHSLFLV